MQGLTPRTHRSNHRAAIHGVGRAAHVDERRATTSAERRTYIATTPYLASHAGFFLRLAARAGRIVSGNRRRRAAFFV
jgi:hypothetical protein